MIVRIRLASALAEYAGGQREFDLDTAADAELGAVVRELSARFPAVGRRVVEETGEVRRHVNVYVGNEECRRLQGLHTVIPEGTTVFIVGSIAGG